MRFTSRITSTVTTAAAAVQPREMPASIQALRPGATSPEEANQKILDGYGWEFQRQINAKEIVYGAELVDD